MIKSNYYKNLEGAIAVIGMSGAFAGAKDIREYWNNLLEGRESIADLTEEDLTASGIPPEIYGNENYIKRAAALSSAKDFDPDFFGYTPAEAKLMDPQHRLFLEHSWKCLEDGNVIPSEYDGLIGVYGGCSQNNYLLKNLIFSDLSDRAGAFQMMINNDKDYLTTKVSYKLNLKGPSITMQTACSTSLTAIQQGCLSLLNYQCDIALCGGVSVNVPHRGGYLYQEGLILSPDGHCRAFDARANGTVFGDGVGVVLLKRLEDALDDKDEIYAVVRGSAINNDGSEKIGYTAPGVKTQAEVIATAQAISEVPVDTIEYIEAHGTGTLMGDPIEIAALTEAFKLGTPKKGYCHIGSVKPNIGHLDAAAGVAGFIKTVLILKEGIIPPQINYETANPALNIEDSPFLITKVKTDWERKEHPRRAGISALGVGGTNVHLIVEEYVVPPKKTETVKITPELFILSAKSEGALQNLKLSVTRFLERDEFPPASAAYTLQQKRVHHPFRDFLVCSDMTGEDKESFLSKTITIPAEENPAIAFLFTGQGSQYPQMGRGLYEKIPYIRQQMDTCFQILLEEKNLELKSVIFPDGEERSVSEKKLMQTTYTQPILFILEYALASYVLELGIKPSYLLGHSLGEYTAACLSGVFSLKDALFLVADRGRIMQTAPEGSMLSIPLTEEAISPYLSAEELQLSVINAPERCVVSGTKAAIGKLKKELDSKDIRNTLLRTSHGYHSFMMDGILNDFSHCFDKIQFGKQKIPIVSNLSGKPLGDDESGNRTYWVNQLRETVNFEAGLSRILDDERIGLLEIGPGNTLVTLSRLHPRIGRNRLVLPLIKSPRQSDDDESFLLNGLGRLWQKGFSLNWDLLYKGQIPSFCRVPTYEFDNRKYWVDGPTGMQTKTVVSSDISESDKKDESSAENTTFRVKQIWSELFGLDTIKEDDNFYDLGGHSVLAVQLLSQINDSFGIELGMGELLMDPTPANSITIIDRVLSQKGETANAPVSPKDKKLPMMFPVQKGDTGKTPLFMVSGLYSNRYYESEEEGLRKWEEDYFRYFSTLVKNIGPEQPIYGFRPKGIFLYEKAHENVQEMAAAYIKAIKKIQPEGPYLIGGECVGGTIAYEMTRQLLEKGEKIKDLIIMDTVHPSSGSLRLDSLRILKNRILEEFFYPLKKSRKSLIAKIGNILYVLFISILPLTARQRALHQVIYGDVIYLRKLRKYKPRPIDSLRINLLANQEWLFKAPTLNWPDNFMKSIRIIPIPGNHVSRLTDQGHITGEHIREIIGQD